MIGKLKETITASRLCDGNDQSFGSKLILDIKRKRFWAVISSGPDPTKIKYFFSLLRFNDKILRILLKSKYSLFCLFFDYFRYIGI